MGYSDDEQGYGQDENWRQQPTRLTNTSVHEFFPSVPWLTTSATDDRSKLHRRQDHCGIRPDFGPTTSSD